MILVLARNEETRKRAATRALFMINRFKRAVGYSVTLSLFTFVYVLVFGDFVDVEGKFVDTEVNDQIGLQIYS